MHFTNVIAPALTLILGVNSMAVPVVEHQQAIIRRNQPMIEALQKKAEAVKASKLSRRQDAAVTPNEQTTIAKEIKVKNEKEGELAEKSKGGNDVSPEGKKNRNGKKKKRSKSSQKHKNGKGLKAASDSDENKNPEYVKYRTGQFGVANEVVQDLDVSVFAFVNELASKE